MEASSVRSTVSVAMADLPAHAVEYRADIQPDARLFTAGGNFTNRPGCVTCVVTAVVGVVPGSGWSMPGDRPESAVR